MEEQLASYEIPCPYCGERVEITIEQDLAGEMIWDCEVCCRPWAVSVRGRGGDREVTARTLED
jgi:hypothetical protein